MAEVPGSDLVSRARFIAENIYRTCISPDDGVRLRETGVISPAPTLKSHRAREAFQWAGHVNMETKFFTKAACREAVKKLLVMPRVEVPQFPFQTKEHWIEQQAKIIQHLCQRSRKNCGSSMRFPAYRQSRTMDWQETLPMEAGPPLLSHNHVKKNAYQPDLWIYFFPWIDLTKIDSHSQDGEGAQAYFDSFRWEYPSIHPSAESCFQTSYGWVVRPKQSKKL